jgi:hypothetical protein
MTSTIAASLTLAIVAFGFGPAPAIASGSIVAAADRCDSNVLDGFETQIRTDEAHPPGDRQAELLARFHELDTTVNGLDMEKTVLDGVCAAGPTRTAYDVRVAADQGWALTLEADTLAKVQPPCPDAFGAMPRLLLATAWLALAKPVNDAGDGVIPAAIVAVVAKIEPRAKSLDLTLPKFADTSDYWRKGVAADTKAALQKCPAPADQPEQGPPGAQPQPGAQPPPGSQPPPGGQPPGAPPG